jgi:hypothetical protein
VQLDEQNPISLTWSTLSRFERHGDSTQVSYTPGGGLKPPGRSGATTAGATRTIRVVTAIGKASSPHVDTLTKRCNNLRDHSAANTPQGLKARPSLRPVYRMPLRLIAGRRSMTVASHGASLRQEEGTDLTDTMTLTIVTASPRSPPTSPIVPIPRTSNQSASPSTTVSKTHTSGLAATPLPLRCQGDLTLPRCSTSWWPWNPHLSLGSRASSRTPSMKRPPIREDLKVMFYQSQEADNTFITSDGTSPYSSAR